MRVIVPVSFIIVVLGAACTALAQRDAVRVDPATGIAGHYGTWTVTYQVGTAGLRPGGAVRVQLPDTWHAGERNSANRLQATDAAGDHYVSAHASRSGVRVTADVESESPDFLVKSSRPGHDGRMERYVFVVRVTLRADRPVRPGCLGAGPGAEHHRGVRRSPLPPRSTPLGHRRGAGAGAHPRRHFQRAPPAPDLRHDRRAYPARIPGERRADGRGDRHGWRPAPGRRRPRDRCHRLGRDPALLGAGRRLPGHLRPAAGCARCRMVGHGRRLPRRRQRSQVRGRIVMAWSSPIWVRGQP